MAFQAGRHDAIFASGQIGDILLLFAEIVKAKGMKNDYIPKVEN
ncbi:MAG TPA: hypothetical protein PK082_04285 [Phycisphaerae bacterium]|nr:hypothetical protein [Phycisphaerae bacterium]